MEERSVRIYNSERTFFSKLTSTISKLLIPTKIGLNGMLIAIKRNNVLKAYENLSSTNDSEKKESLTKKLDDAYALYLEAIDKHIMDTIYKKVKNDTANEFEKEALSQYYVITHLKESSYTEYKYRKQIYLIGLDYQNVLNEKPKVVERYKKFYCAEAEMLYKGVLKHYSIRLADNMSDGEKDEIYNKIFKTLEEYISNILPIKFEIEQNETYKEILDEYDNFDKFSVGKLDQNDVIEKNTVLLGLSRKLFTHSLPLVVAEQCYNKLLNDTRSLIVDTKVIRKQEKAYSLLMHIIEEYNTKLLSTKIYWEKPEQREKFKKFWDKYKEIEQVKNQNYEEFIKQKEILFIRNELNQVYENENKYYKIIKFYNKKLVELGDMRNLFNSYTSTGEYKKVAKKTKRKTRISKEAV